MILEIQRGLPFGVGLRFLRWPKSRHVVLHLGRIESRVIVTDGPRSRLGVALLLIGGLVTGIKN